MADKVLIGQQHDLAGGAGDGEGTYQLFLGIAQLQNGQFGDEGHAFAAFYHAHKGLHAAQVIGKLAGTCRLHLAEAHQLVAEAMALVEQPKLFAVQVGSTDYLVVEEGVFARHVGKELFIEQRRLLQLFHTCQTRYDTCIYLSRLQGFLDVVCFHFDYPDVEVGVFLHQLRK